MAKVHLIGNAHLDPIWLWRWQEGCNEVMQTAGCNTKAVRDRASRTADRLFS